LIPIIFYLITWPNGHKEYKGCIEGADIRKLMCLSPEASIEKFETRILTHFQWEYRR